MCIPLLSDALANFPLIYRCFGVFLFFVFFLFRESHLSVEYYHNHHLSLLEKKGREGVKKKKGEESSAAELQFGKKMAQG